MLKGSFHLQPMISLIPETGKEAAGGGIVVQPNPMRALKMNAKAFSILKKCQTGFSLETGSESADQQMAPKTISFLDTLCQANILEWRPPENSDTPLVSIVVAVYNRCHDLYGCLESIKNLDYPSSKLQLIVVDDASTDGSADVARQFEAKVIVQPMNLGQSAARNRGVIEASGDIVAFIDSDCIADSQWLSDLVPYFNDHRYALVGGFVDSYYQKSRLDRYESVKSALNMGEKKVVGAGANAVFYVPTCNLLVRKDAYIKIGGLDESMRVGEDVDFCWRLMKTGYRLIYVPKGKVRHKHRNQFFACFKRRFDYGTSEPELYSKFPETTKRFPWQAGGMVFLFFCVLGLIQSVFFFLAAGVLLLCEAGFKKIQMEKKFKMILPFGTLLWCSFRSHFLFSYFLTSHITRYYFLALVLITIIFMNLAPLVLAVLFLPGLVEFFQKKPRLSLPVFIFYFWMEQIFYQAGVIIGCLRKKNFSLYRISFAHAGFIKSENGFWDRLKNVFSSRRL